MTSLTRIFLGLQLLLLSAAAGATTATNNLSDSTAVAPPVIQGGSGAGGGARIIASDYSSRDIWEGARTNTLTLPGWFTEKAYFEVRWPHIYQCRDRGRGTGYQCSPYRGSNGTESSDLRGVAAAMYLSGVQFERCYLPGGNPTRGKTVCKHHHAVWIR